MIIQKQNNYVTVILLVILLHIISIANCEVNKINIINKITLKHSKNSIKKINFDNNILYYSRHNGTISNFSSIAESLNLNLTILKPSVSNILIKGSYCFYIILIKILFLLFSINLEINQIVIKKINVNHLLS